MWGFSGYRSIVPASKDTILIVISIVLALVTLIFFLVKRLRKFWPYSFALLAVSTAYLLNFLIRDISSIWSKVDKGTPLGLAVAKITDAISLIVIIFLFNRIL